jgi:hypothetical protein
MQSLDEVERLTVEMIPSPTSILPLVKSRVRAVPPIFRPYWSGRPYRHSALPPHPLSPIPIDQPNFIPRVDGTHSWQHQRPEVHGW